MAATRLPEGGVVLVALDHLGRAILSRNEGLTWEAVPDATGREGKARDVVWFPGWNPPSNGPGVFVVAGEESLRLMDPITGWIQDMSADLPEDDHYVLDLSAPRQAHGGPAALVTLKGNVYLLWPGDLHWRLAFRSGLHGTGRRAVVEVVPHFDASAGPGPSQTLALAVQGVLHLSTDAGATWSVHSQFSTPAQSSGDWYLTSLAFAEDYEVSGRMVLGRGRPVPVDGGLQDEGEIWQSDDFAANFQNVLDLGTAVYSLVGAPAGPSGRPRFLAAGRLFPDTLTNAGVGLLASEDGGLTWDDHGNEQDFLLEEDRTDRTGYGPLTDQQGFALHPDYAATGVVFYCRQQGAWRSEDEGLHWLPMRSRTERQVRDVETAWGSEGGAVAVGVSYGGCMNLYNLDDGTSQELAQGSPARYGRRVAFSPSYDRDGTILLGDTVTLSTWYDPRLAAANPFGTVGWAQPRAIDPGTGRRLGERARIVAMSPHYDGTARAGSDQTFFWFSWSENAIIRTEDGGLTGEILDQVAGGGGMDRVDAIVVAPTYDAAGERKDAYAASGGKLYRLEGSVWHLVVDLKAFIVRMEVDPDWSRPDNPRLFLALQAKPYVVAVMDDPAGPTVKSLQENLEEVMPSGIATGPGFHTRPVLYLSTSDEGVWRRNVMARDQWTKVGRNFPPFWCEDVAVSPDPASGPLVVAGTSDGVWVVRDSPDEPWRRWTPMAIRDDSETNIPTFAPNDPRNPQPDRPWPWAFRRRDLIHPEMEIFGPGVHYATTDGAWFETRGVAQEIHLWTARGSGMGTVHIDAWDILKGNLAGSTTLDLSGGPLARRRVSLRLDRPRPLRIEVRAELDPGEVLVFDGLELIEE